MQLRALNSNFDLIPARHKTNENTETLLLQDSTVIALPCTTYNPIQYIVLGFLHPLGNNPLKEQKYVQH